MKSTKTPRAARVRRHVRLRKKILGTQERPRLAVFRSLSHIYVQVIDDRQGHTLAEPLMESKVFPPMVTRMVQIGEKSGSLEQLLEKISDFYDDQVSAAVKTLTSMIEPIMIGIMGFLVGGIVLAVFLPIFELQKQLGKRN